MSFTNPWGLLLLLVLPLLIWVGQPRRTAPRQWREWSSVVLRVVIVACLILALSGAQTVRSADDLAVVFLVDGSDSINAEQAQQAELFVREAVASMKANDQAAVIVFGANSLVDRPMSTIADLSSFTSLPQTLHTDIAEAIRLGLAIFPAGSARRLVILSDGASTLGDPAEAARLAAANGVQIDYVPLLREDVKTEAWLTAVSSPSRLSEGEKFNVEVQAFSTVDTAATLRVLSGGQIVYESNVPLRVGDNNFPIPLQAGTQEFARYTVQLIPQQDTYYQNNQLAAFTEVTGPPRVLVVSMAGLNDDNGRPYPDEASQLVRALQTAGLEIEQASPYDLPSNFADLSNYASVVLVNINAKYLTPRKMEALQSYVRDLGGGLVAIGGPESFGMGGYYKTPLEAALPVDMQIKDEERFPSVSMVIVIDRSGSMAASEGGLTKIQLAAEGAVRVVELLNELDEITVIPVDTAPSDQIGPAVIMDREQIIEQIRRIGAGGGGIYIRTGLEAAAEALNQTDNQVKHIIVLADGSDSEEKEGVPELLEKFVEQGVTVSMVAIGNGGDVAWLQQMAEAGNGRFHFTDRAANLPQIFTQETTSIQRSYLIEERFFPTLGRSNPIISGITQVKALGGYVGTSPKDTAQVVLKTHMEDPLLASWQYGLGRSVAWTSDVSGRWAGEWVQWEAFPVFWAQAVRWTISNNRDSTVETVVTFGDEQARLLVDARTPEGVFLNNLPLTVNVVDPAGRPQEVVLQQIAPGRYEGFFTPTDEGAYFIRVATEGESNGTAVGQTTGWVLGYSPEYGQFKANPQLLAALADLTNGRNLQGEPLRAFEHSLPSETIARPLTFYLLLVAICLLPFDIAVRRLVITRRDMSRAWAATAGRLIPGRAVVELPAERAEQMSSLFAAKKRAQAPRPAESEEKPPVVVQPIQRQDAPPPTPIVTQRPPEPPSRPVGGGQSDPAGGSLASRLLKKKRDQGEE